MRVAVHFPAGHPLTEEGGVVAYRLGRIRDGIDNHMIHTGETVPLDEFAAGLVAQAKAEYPDATVKIERLVQSEDGETATWVADDEFDAAVHTPAAAGESKAAEINVQAEVGTP